MRQFIAEDDASAGKGVSLTSDVAQHLAWIGSTVGPVLDEVRKAIHLNSLSKVRANETVKVYVLFKSGPENSIVRVGRGCNPWCVCCRKYGR